MTRLSEEQYNEIMQRRGVKSSAPAIEIEIPGKIQGKDRPRFYKGHAVTTENTRNYEELVRLIYRQKYKDFMIEGPITAKVEIIFPIPKKTSKKNRAEMLDGLILPTKKKDIDNILKVLFDSLNKIAYHDDSSIVEVYCIKHYGEEEGVKLQLNQFTIQTKIEV